MAWEISVTKGFICDEGIYLWRRDLTVVMGFNCGEGSNCGEGIYPRWAAQQPQEIQAAASQPYGDKSPRHRNLIATGNLIATATSLPQGISLSQRSNQNCALIDHKI